MLMAFKEFLQIVLNKAKVKKSEKSKRIIQVIIMVMILETIYGILLWNIPLLAIPYFIFMIIFSASFGSWYITTYRKTH